MPNEKMVTVVISIAAATHFQLFLKVFKTRVIRVGYSFSDNGFAVSQCYIEFWFLCKRIVYYSTCKFEFVKRLGLFVEIFYQSFFISSFMRKKLTHPPKWVIFSESQKAWERLLAALGAHRSTSVACHSEDWRGSHLALLH